MATNVKKFFAELDGERTAHLRHHLRATTGDLGARLLAAIDADVEGGELAEFVALGDELLGEPSKG